MQQWSDNRKDENIYMTRDELLALARLHYADDGPNQWPHIMRVLEQADRIAENRGRNLTKAELAAVLLHDAAKHLPKYQGIDHGEASADLARSILKDKLKERTVASISNAIAQHNYDKEPDSKLAELLMAADANVPNLPWFLRKSYNKVRKEYGYTDEQAVRNAYEWAKKGTPLLANKQYKPKPWLDLFKDDIKKTQRDIDNLKMSQVKKLIREYDSKHPGESSYA